MKILNNVQCICRLKLFHFMYLDIKMSRFTVTNLPLYSFHLDFAEEKLKKSEDRAKKMFNL